jgi:hypothetical protein
MNFETFVFIAKISMASALVSFLLGLAKFRSISSELKLLLILTGVSFASDMAALYHTQLKIGTNYISDAYRLAEFILLIGIYYRAFNNPKTVRPLLILTALFILFFIFNMIFFQREKINSYTYIVSALVFIVLAVGFFYKLMKDLPALQVYLLPMFWVNVAVLVYFAGNLFVFTLSHYLVTVLNNNLMVYWGFHNFLSILKNVLFAVGFYLSTRSPAETK